MVVLPARRQSLLQFLADYNPFYLLSAMCMVFGVFALNDYLNWSPLPMRNLLRIIITLNIYECALIALAIFLMKRDIRRDATMLLIIEAFFLADVGFLNMEVFAVNAHVGLLVNLLVLAAAVVKVMLVFGAAGISLRDGRFTFVLMQLGVLCATPGVFGIIAQRHDNYLHPLAIYGGWWLAGLLPAAFPAIVGSGNIFRRRTDGQPAGAELIVSRILLVLPMLSLIAHLCLANWVYKVTFHPLNLSPLLLGLAVAVGRSDSHVGTLAWRMRMQMVLPFVAVALSAIKFPSDFIFVFHNVHISPLRITLLGATLVYLDGLWMHRHVYFALGAGVWMTALAMGHNVKAMNTNSTEVARTSADALSRLMPRTLAEWGVFSIVAAFVLLGLGAMVSLIRQKPAMVEEVSADNEELN